LTTDFEMYPGIESFTVKWPRFAVRDGGRLYFRLPESFAGLFRYQSDTRANPLYRGGPYREVLRATIELPGEFARAPLVPPSVDWRSPAGGSTVAVRVEAPTRASPRLAIRWEADLVPSVVPAERYGEMLEIMRTLDHPAARTVLLGR
jgi:hypothetical protein